MKCSSNDVRFELNDKMIQNVNKKGIPLKFMCEVSAKGFNNESLIQWCLLFDEMITSFESPDNVQCRSSSDD